MTPDSTEGFSVEFATLNPQGFFFYSLYTVAGFIDPHIGAGTVETNDLFFALHAFMISSIQLMQIFVYDGTAPKGLEGGKTPQKQTPRVVLWPVLLIIGEWIFVLILFFLEVGGTNLDKNIQFLRGAGYCKALITFVKYMPQVGLI